MNLKPTIPTIGTPVVGITPNGRDPEYSAAFFEFCKRDHGLASWMFGEVIRLVLHPSSVIEFGCGIGYTLAPLHLHGIKVYGIDVSEAARLYAQEVCPDLVQHIRIHDINEPAGVSGWYDVAVCIEVLEHLRPESADQAVADLCSSVSVRQGGVILATACPPTATHNNPLHLNEEPWERWVARFADHGFEPDPKLTSTFRGIMRALHDLGEYTVPAWFFSHYFGAFRRMS